MLNARTLGAVVVIGVLAGLAWFALPADAFTEEGEAPADETAELMVEQLELENEKLRQEIESLESDRSGWARALVAIPLLGALVAATATAVGVIRQWRETNRQREADRRQREREAEQRLEERMADAVANLSSDSESLQASSTASLLALLVPRRPVAEPEARGRGDGGARPSEATEPAHPLDDPVRRTIWLVLANLKLEHTPAVQRQLVKVYEQALRTHYPAMREESELLLDLSRAHLARIDLSGLDLRGIDIGFAGLSGAILSGADLYRVRGYRVNLDGARLSVLRHDDASPTPVNLGEARLRNASARDAQFHEARLNSARLEEADLRRAEFQGARLQAAHLNKADLRGAIFDGANVSDTDFRGARFDEVALQSLRRTRRNKQHVKSWKRAKLDPEHRAVLEGRA